MHSHRRGLWQDPSAGILPGIRGWKPTRPPLRSLFKQAGGVVRILPSQAQGTAISGISNLVREKRWRAEHTQLPHQGGTASLHPGGHLRRGSLKGGAVPPEQA